MIGELGDFSGKLALNELRIINPIAKNLEQIKNEHITLTHLRIGTQNHLTTNKAFLLPQTIRILNITQITKRIRLRLIDLFGYQIQQSESQRARIVELVLGRFGGEGGLF